jgi:hypothetical protein
MRTRRVFLVTGLGLMVLSAGRRARAVGVESEGAVYGGQTSGGWICGPVGTARYAGAGVQVGVSQRERSDPAGRGFLGDVAGAGERMDVSLLSCREGGCTEDRGLPQLDRLMFGGRVRGGYEWRYARVEAGLGAYQGWEYDKGASVSDAFYLSTRLYPDVSVAFGKLRRIYGVIGFGTPLVTELLRPGFYGGVGLTGTEGFGVELYGGEFRQGPGAFDDGGPRVDLVTRAPIPGTSNLYLRLGSSVGAPDRGPTDWELSLGLAAGY